MLPFLALAIVLGAAPARAHPLAPAVLELHAEPDGIVAVRWRQSLPRPRGTTLRPVFPPSCRNLEPAREERAADAVTARWRVDCGAGGLVGRAVGVDGLVAPLAAIVRVELASGHVADGVLTSETPRFVVPAAPSAIAVARDYVRLGLEHIARGPDHLLFVMGLVLLAAGWRQVLAMVTAFTLGHSITLALATLGAVTLPSGPVELAIALSVLVVAIEVAEHERKPAASWARRPWLMACAFGLLHGLGFASVLEEAGLPSRAIPLALVAFNVGIELGQIAFVLLVLAVRAAVARLAGPLPPWLRRAPAYVMGSAAAYWCFQRAAAWLATFPA
ncbi:MAG TPA: HupE/UreJ family protein [Candidatus Limnocylindria bacterium]|nr:HupE/UreJ family protein [Candidatus Limnocylindria bacterium]